MPPSGVLDISEASERLETGVVSAGAAGMAIGAETAGLTSAAFSDDWRFRKHFEHMLALAGLPGCEKEHNQFARTEESTAAGAFGWV